MSAFKVDPSADQKTVAGCYGSIPPADTVEKQSPGRL